MTTKTMLFQLAAAVAVFGGTILMVPLQTVQYALAAGEDATTSAGPFTAAGSIANIQDGGTGQPEWIQSGFWVLRISSVPTQTAGPEATLIARFEMIKPDGTAMHEHKVYNFVPTGMTQDGNATEIKGTATVTMKDSPIADVPVTLKVFNSAVIGFWIGPDKVDGHFGTAPVYGILSANSKAAMDDVRNAILGANGSGGQGQNPTGGGTGQTNVIKMGAKEVDEVYRWSSDAGINPGLKLVANADNVIQIDNPTDAKHELVFESNGMELAASGDIAPGGSGQLSFKPTTTGTFEYHCEYHPSTMKGTVQVTGPVS